MNKHTSNSKEKYKTAPRNTSSCGSLAVTPPSKTSIRAINRENARLEKEKTEKRIVYGFNAYIWRNDRNNCIRVFRSIVQHNIMYVYSRTDGGVW